MSFKIIMIYDDDRDKIVFHNATPDLQDQEKIKADFWSQTGLVLRPTVSDHITANSEHVN